MYFTLRNGMMVLVALTVPALMAPRGCGFCNDDVNMGYAGEAGASTGGSLGEAGGTGDNAGAGAGGEAGRYPLGEGGSAGSSTGCFSPTQNLDTAYSGGIGCACVTTDHDRCIDGVGLVCVEGRWTAVEDGPCTPSRCNFPLDIDQTCDIEYKGYWHNAATGQCEPVSGGCPRNINAFTTLEDCVATCQDQITPTAVVPWSNCQSLGDGYLQITEAGDESTFTREGDVIEGDLNWGCGCPKRPEFIMVYEPVSPLELRLCLDEMADSCEALCRNPRFDLGQAFQAVGTNSYVFVD